MGEETLDKLDELGSPEASGDEVEEVKPDNSKGSWRVAEDRLVEALNLTSPEVTMVEYGEVESLVSQGHKQFVIGNESLIQE